MAEILASDIMNKASFVNLMNGVLVSSSSELLRALLMNAVSHMDKGGGLPKPIKLNIKSGQLARVVSSPEDIKQEGTNLQYDTISAERTIHSAYASVHEFGGTFPFQSRAQINAMFRRLKASGEYDEGKLSPRGSGKKSYTFPSRPFIKPAIEDSSANIESLKRIIKRNLKQAFVDKRINVTVR